MRILYAEDEKQLSMAVNEILQMEGYEVDCAYDGEQAWEKIKNGYYDAAILDVMMPKMDGMEVLRLMREQENFTPVLMLTAKTTTEDRIDGLSTGADDYLGKPFVMKELLARLNSIIRRSDKYKNSVFKYKNVVLNSETNELKSDNSSLIISSKEGKLLELLIKNSNRGITAEEICKELWDGKDMTDSVNLYMSYVKNKLSQIQADFSVEENNSTYVLKGR